MKCVKQNYFLSDTILRLSNTFRRMVNDCIRIGLENDVTTKIKLTKLSYHELKKYDIYANYKLCAINRAAGILENRKKSIKRGFKTKTPYMTRPVLIGYLGFKIDLKNNLLRVPLGNKQYYDIPISRHTREILLDPHLRIHSFTLAANTMTITYSREVSMIDTTNTAGIDRNLRNLTYGNSEKVTQYDLSQTVEIAETTRDIIKSFKRNDVRIRRKLTSKYGQRRSRRIHQILHRVSKHIVQHAKENKSAIVLEDIRYIRRLYQRGNYQGKNYRYHLNGWSFAEIGRQIEYKAAWEGIPVIQLSVKETRGASQFCPRCGKRTQVANYDDRHHYRQLWCDHCQRWQDRDIVAAMNLSLKGLLRFGSSKGDAGEAMKGNLERDPIILRVDASKLSGKRL